jgi:hypothetical protein
LPHPDAWLFLPPEVEALVPRLLARLAVTGGGSPDDEIVAEYAGDDAEARRVLASILDDQFLLARAVVDLEPADLDARRRLARAGATPPRSSRAQE